MNAIHAARKNEQWEDVKNQLQRISSLRTILKPKSNVILKPSNEYHMALSRVSHGNEGLKKEKANKLAVTTPPVGSSNPTTTEADEIPAAESAAVSNLDALEPVVGLINTNYVYNSVNNEIKRRYALSLATLACKPSKRLTIVQEGAITVLVELCSVHDKAIQLRCASALTSLALEPLIRRKMIEDGVLAAIVYLAANCNVREVKVDCIRALCNLSCEVGFEYRMVKEGIPYMCTHIATSCTDQYDECLKVLMNITCVRERYARIEEITEALMHFVNNNLLLSYEQELLLLTAFRNLAGMKNNQLRLVEDGCLKIVERFYHSEEAQFRMMSGEILRSLTTDYKSRLKLLEQNILSILLQMYHDVIGDIRMVCAKAMLNLMEEESFRHQVVHGIAIQFVLHFAEYGDTPNVEVCQVVAQTLRKLCADSGLASSLVEKGIGQTIVFLLNFYDDRVTHQYCAEAVGGLCQSQDIVERLTRDDVAQHMVHLAGRTANSLTSEWCSYALYQLCKAKSPILDVQQTDILNCIIRLCEADFSTEITKRFSSAAFAYATQSKKYDCSSAIPLLVKMLRDEGSQVVKKYCAMSLFNLADDEENCFKMLDSQALSPVVQLTQSDNILGDSDPKVICAGIISCLSLHKNYYDQFASGNVLKVLLELSCVDHRLTQRRVVIALSNLSQNEELKLKLLELNPIPYIIKLASARDEYLRRGCIAIICNMSYIPGSEKAIVDAGIMPTLMITSLITSDQMASKIICVKALINLMADKSLFKVMVKEGVIWGLSKLAQLDNRNVLCLCAKALCILSKDFARDFLSSTVAVNTILALVSKADDEVVVYGARLLTNVLLETNNTTDEHFHKRVVDKMLPLAQSKEREVNELCIICLCLASQSECSRAGIVSSGMLQMIDAGTIFSDNKVSYAYITMFGNIANNPVMRSRVLDMHMIDRLKRICEAKIYSLDVAVVKALYCLSCSSENIPKLVNQGIVLFIESMIDIEYQEEEDGKELLSHMIACLYNLTTSPEILHELVSQGIVEIMVSLWDSAKRDKDLCILSYLSICHLACGRTNTARMVNDGCFAILCFISEYRERTQYNNYNFSVDVYLRASASFRNLLSVVSNQRSMVEQGCLATIISIANFSSLERFKEQEPLDPLFGDHEGVWRNCCVALTSLTYNHELRETLLQSEAINIILTNSERDVAEISLGHGLLKELEAESWDNGARGKVKDGRSRLMKPAKLYTELLKGGSNVKLNVSVTQSQLEKYCIQIQLNDPDLMSADDRVRAAAAAAEDPSGMEDSLGLGALKAYEDAEELLPSSYVPVVSDRLGCFSPVDTTSLLRVDDIADNDGTASTSSSDVHDSTCTLPIINSNAPSNVSTPTQKASVEIKLDDFVGNHATTGSHLDSQGSAAAAETSIGAEESSLGQSSVSSSEPTTVGVTPPPASKKKVSQYLPSMVSVASMMVQHHQNTKEKEKQQQQVQQLEQVKQQEQVKQETVSRMEMEKLSAKKKLMEKQTDLLLSQAVEDQEFKSLVATIKQARESKDSGGIDKVLHHWRSYSKF